MDMEKPEGPSKIESDQTSLPADIDRETKTVIDDVIAQAKKTGIKRNNPQQLN